MNEISAPRETTSLGNRPLPPHGILSGLSEESLANLAPFGHYEKYPTGTDVIREGEKQDRFYIVVSGKLTVSALACGKQIPLSVAEPGECLGEVSLLEPGAATASVRVEEDAVLWSMNIDDLRSYLAEHAGGGGSLLMGMAACLSKRLRNANQLISKHHVPPVETLPEGRERAITADNTPLTLGFFDKLKQTLTPRKTVKIPTRIKM